MIRLDIENLIERHPQLFHMAEAGSWPAIREHGLITTEMIVRTAGLPDDEVDQLLRERRAHSTTIEHPTLGRVVIRDQGPLNLTHLQPKLTDMSVTEWLETLNSRVFFWLHPDKLRQLLTARRYRNSDHDVITVDTRRLLDAVGDRARLSAINSGAALYPNATPRGSGTFTSIADYDYETQRRRRGRIDAIVELAVSDGVPDLRDVVVSAQRMRGSSVIEELDIPG